MQFFKCIFLFVCLTSVIGNVASTQINKNNYNVKSTGIKVVECFRKALTGGLPEAGIPDHNPLHISDKQLQFDAGVMKGSVYFTDIVLEEMVKFDLVHIDGIQSEMKEKMNFNYSIYWDKVRLKGNYVARYSILNGIKESVAGDISVTFRGLLFDGMFNVRLGKFRHLEDFTIYTPAKRIDVIFTGLGPIVDGFISQLVSNLLTQAFNDDTFHFVFSEILSLLVKQKLNQEWIDDHPLRTDIVFNHCTSSKRNSRTPTL